MNFISMTRNTIKKTPLLAIIALLAMGLITGTAYAVTSSGPWYDVEDNTSDSCGTNLTNTSEYACADAYAGGNMYFLTKANGWLETVTAQLAINQNGNTIGSSPELTTSSSTVTFSGQFDVTGEIEEKSGANVSVIYGVILYKQNGSSWTTVGFCNQAMSQDGTYSETNKVVECAISNSGTNTYRIAAYADSTTITNFSSGASYADFYTGSNRISLDNLKIN